MKNHIIWGMIGLLALVVVGTLGTRHFLKVKVLNDSTQKETEVTEADTSQSLCFLSGILQSTKTKKNVENNGFDALNGMIRIRMEVDSLKDCRDQSIAYCRNKVNEGFTPSSLILAYRAAHSDTTEKQEISDTCKFISEKSDSQD